LFDFAGERNLAKTAFVLAPAGYHNTPHRHVTESGGLGRPFDNDEIDPSRGPKWTDLIALQRIARWEKLKALVLDSVSSPITRRVYNTVLNEFLAWFQQAPRPGFTRATVSAWRLGSSSIVIRMSAIGGGRR
jgi:hypothetical protein